MKKSILLTFILSLFTVQVIGQTPNNNSNSHKKKDAKFNFFRKEKTFVKNPFDLRDPFKRKSIKLKSRAKVLRGNKVVFSNSKSIDNTPIDQIKIVGIFLGAQRRAMAKIIDNKVLGKETYMLKEGMKLGLNNAELKAILPGGIVLVEKIRNVYDQDEYLETIIPVHDQ
jgi:type IV pilus assembly protein PilP